MTQLHYLVNLSDDERHLLQQLRRHGTAKARTLTRARILLQADQLCATTQFAPPLTSTGPQHLCLDKGDDNLTGYATVAAYQYTPRIRRIGAEKLDASGQKTYLARRWMVERTLAWLSKCLGLLVWYEKKSITFLGLL